MGSQDTVSVKAIGSSVCVRVIMNYLLIITFTALIASSQGLLGFGNKCVPVPSHLCAYAYDDDGCEGWRLDIPVGEQMFKWWDPVWYWYRNDIEQVSVRAGCSFTGFDDSSYNGESFTIRAGATDRHVDLSEEDDFGILMKQSSHTLALVDN